MRHGSEGSSVGTVFTHARLQAAVGQGGFHIGGLKAGPPSPWFFAAPTPDYERFRDADVLYVYDCGAVPKRHVLGEIWRFAQTQPQRRLDVLALSHFDIDHICGTPHLLGPPASFKVDTILLPYVDDAERLFAMAAAAADAEALGGQIPRFFVDMVLDPVSALGRFRPGRIILVRPEDGDGIPPLAPAAPTELPDGLGWGAGDTESRRTRGFAWRVKQANPNRPWRLEVLPAPASAPHVIAVTNVAFVANNADWSAVWKLRPYTRAAPPADLAKFKAQVEKVFGWPAGAFDVESAAIGVRRKMVTSHRSKLAKAYQNAFTDKNLTSMSLYSGPMDPDQLDAECVLPTLDDHHLTKVGWLGTGDAHLREQPERDAFKAAYAADLPVTATFVLPHHGSIKNSDPLNLVSDADSWVAAADPRHKWQHPHWALQGVVEANGGNFEHVRSPPGTAFEEAFLLKKKGTP